MNAANKVKLKKIAIVGITSVIATSAVATIIHASSLDIEKKKSQEKAIEQKIKLEMLEEERIRDEAVSNKMEEQKDAMRYFKDREQPASKTDRVEVETNTDSFVDERTSNEQDLIDKLNEELKQIRSYIAQEEEINTQSTDNVNLEILRKREKQVLAKLDKKHKQISDRNKKMEDLDKLKKKHMETVEIEREQEQKQREMDTKDEEMNKGNKFQKPIEFISNLFSGDGKSMDIPSGNTSNKTYMSYHAITTKSSPQYRLQHDSKTTTDKYGLRRRGEDYVVALGSYYGTKIGQRYQISFESGTTITAILGDCKSDRHTDSKGQQHLTDGSVVEFITDSADKLNSSIRRKGNVSEHPGVNFKGNVVSIQKIK